MTLQTTSFGVLLLLLFSGAVASSAQSITDILSQHRRLSNFNRLLAITNVAAEIDERESLTILAPDDDLLQPLMDSNLPLEQVADILRYHILEEYFSIDDIESIAKAKALVSTLYQTTGKAEPEMRFVKFTVEKEKGTFGVGLPYPSAGSSGSIRKSLLEVPERVSVLEISSVILPMAATTFAPAPAPAPVPVNVTQIMESAGQFSTFLSLLSATKVDVLFQTQANKTGTGITIFAPIDKAFSSLPSGVLNKLTAQQKISILQFHALSAFYPLSALQQATDPVTPTLATDFNGAGRFTINITNQEGTVVISTGLVNSPIISTLYNTNPCAVFAISKVLLPEDIFGLPAPSPAPSPLTAPESSPSPLSSSTGKAGAAGPSNESSQAPSLLSVQALFVATLILCGFKLSMGY